MRRVQSPRAAVERLIEKFGVPRPEKQKRPIQELAFMLDLLKRKHADRFQVQDAIRWRGRIPARGLSGWEEEALEWARVE